MADTTPFVTLRMEGSRFDETGMPVEALPELVAYRELLLEVGKAVFYRNHPGRQRLPRGFGDRLQLRLRRVEAGSSIPILERVSTDEQPAMLPRDDEFVAARQLIEDAIVAVAAGDGLPAEFPAAAVGYFNRFGKSLQDDEAITLGRPGGERAARYTPSVRRTLLLSHARTYRSNREAVGRVVEINAIASTFMLRAGDREAFTCHYESELFSFIRDALGQDGAGPGVLVEGEAVLDDRDRIQRMVVTEITYAEDADDPVMDGGEGPTEERVPAQKFRQRLAELASMQDGWLEGQGHAPSAYVIDALRSVTTELTADDMPPFQTYPTPEGGVQLEWRSGTTELSIEIRADLSLYAVEVDPANGEPREWASSELDFTALINLLRNGVDI